MPIDDNPDTLPTGPASEWEKLSTIAPAPAPRDEQAHALEFSGSGSEYFRIWIVNLLLTLVTLGLYYPWAKVRKLKYFYGNTQLAGHAFDFHGDPKRMLRGYLLVGALFSLYGLAGQFSVAAGLIALAIVAAIWPALLHASQRFRLSQTSWRGLRLAFVAEPADAYRALWPALAAALALLGFMELLTPGADDDAPAKLSAGAAAGFFLVLALFYLALPYLLWRLKQWQHGHYQYASLRTRFTAPPWSFYKLAFKTAGLLVAAIVVLGVLIAVAGGLGGRPSGARVALMILVGLLGYAAILFSVQPYITSRLQNLVWNHTASRSLRFESDLRFAPLVRLTVINWLLVVLTLGLYWPFAAVATARLRLESVQVLARADLDALVARGGSATQDASGDAAADVFGIDIGM